MSMDYQAEDQAFHEEVAQEMKGHDREQLRKRRAICQCGSAAKDRACKMDCPGSEVEQ